MVLLCAEGRQTLDKPWTANHGSPSSSSVCRIFLVVMLRGMPTPRFASVSSRGGPASAPTSSARGSAAMRFCSRRAAPAATGSTPTTTRRACDRCKAISRKGCRPQRRRDWPVRHRRARLRTAVRQSSPERCGPPSTRSTTRALRPPLTGSWRRSASRRSPRRPSFPTCARSAMGRATATPPSAQEHFATGLLRTRLMGLARGWDRGAGPGALFACPSGERHDLGLIILGLALRDRG